MSIRKGDFLEGGSPVRPLSEPDRWTPPAPVDHQAIMAEAHALRTAALMDLSNALKRLWRKAVAQPVGRWIERERALRELSRLDDRELADLGITRDLIPFVAAGKFTPYDEGARREIPPANENKHNQKAA